MTPAEFKAVQRGYQLHLTDQRDQILFGKQIPQRSVSVETKQPLGQLLKMLSDRNDDLRKETLNVHTESSKRLALKRNLIQNLFGS